MKTKLMLNLYAHELKNAVPVTKTAA